MCGGVYFSFPIYKSGNVIYTLMASFIEGCFSAVIEGCHINLVIGIWNIPLLSRFDLQDLRSYL